MTARHWLPALGAAALIATAATADDPKGASGDPLPQGAKVRLGSTRMRVPTGWYSFALAADGRSLVTLSERGKVIAIDVTTGAVNGGPVPFVRPVRMELSADGTRGVTTGYGGPVVYDLATGTVKAKIDFVVPFGESSGLLSADGKVLALGGGKGANQKVRALVWDVEKNEKRAEVEVLQNQAANAVISGDGTVLATWGNHFKEFKPGAEPKPEEDHSRVAQFWDAASGAERGRYRVSGYAVSTVALAPDGKTAVVGSGDGGVYLVDTTNGALLRRLFGRSDQGNRVAFSKDGKRVAVGGADGTVQIYDPATGARVSRTGCPVGPLPYGGVRELKFTGAGTVTAWAVVNAAAVVWEVPSGRLLSPTGGHTGAVDSVAFTADGKTVLTAGNGAVLRWDPATGKQTGAVRLRAPGRAGDADALGARFGPGALTIRTGGSAPAVYETESGDQLFALRGPGDYNSESILCTDGRTLLVATRPGGPAPKAEPAAMRVPVWDTTTGIKLAELEPRFGTLVAAGTSPDRKTVVTLVGVRVGDTFKTDHFVTGWDLATGKNLGEVPVAPAPGQHVLVPAPDNTAALVATESGKLAVVDFVAGKVVREIDTERQVPTAVSPFSPDGKWFAVGSGSSGFGPKPAVRVYDWKSGKVVRTFRGHDTGIQSLAFSPDGKALASGSLDTTVLLWDISEK
ncbi:WD40 repeat domain-containing protein [Frigoriglobus tundricola]|uniref:Pyrrolo-quinoline quinone repeat domain-containing protein n=1 Tax=Frigoriglobus tundricola TaxID=2774151 RepID=A0A6M5YJ93_9BACT|nr:PQQ-binding-like beta-propeller repeat protein [Frigoriglobus tundricola]QJW94038.1 hypothetical protein FTUN_1557 [Frigoriglobus tundricola]